MTKADKKTHGIALYQNSGTKLIPTQESKSHSTKEKAKL